MSWDDVDVHFEVAFGYTLQDAAPVFMDISHFVESFDTVRGRIGRLTHPEAGTSHWWIDNSSGRFDPNNSEDGPNQIRNPGFEDGTLNPHKVFDTAGGSADWQVVNDAGEARNGGWVLRHDASGLTANTRLQFNGTEGEGPDPHIPIAAGRWVKGVCQARSDTVANANRVRLRAEFFNAAGAHVGGHGGDWLTPSTGAWEEFSVTVDNTTVVAPAGAVYVVFDIEVEDTGNPEDIIWFDDVEGYELYPEVKIGVPARIRVVHDSTDYQIIGGSVPEWPLEYVTSGEYAWLQLPIVNSRLSSLSRDISGSFPIERTDQRIDRILDAVGWPAAKRDLDVGVAFVAAADLAAANALEHIDEMVMAEVGHFFIAANGDAAFRARTANAGGSAVSQATFGADEIEFDEIGITYNDDEVYNEVRFLRTGGIVQVAEDTDAQDDLGYTITFPDAQEDAAYESAVFYTDHSALNAADWFLGRHKDVKVRIRSLKFSPMFDAGAWVAALGLDLRQAVTAQWSPPGGGTALNQLVTIEGIRHEAVGGGKWVTTYNLAPLSDIEVEDYWILGTSQLGVDARLA